jgi:hypothetical protein
MWENEELRVIKERVAVTAFVISTVCTEITVQLTVTLTTTRHTDIQLMLPTVPHMRH